MCNLRDKFSETNLFNFGSKEKKNTNIFIWSWKYYDLTFVLSSKLLLGDGNWPRKHDNDQFGLEQPWNAKFKFLILFDQLSLNYDDGKINEKRTRRGSLTDRFPTRKDFKCFMVRNFFWSAETYFPKMCWWHCPSLLRSFRSNCSFISSKSKEMALDILKWRLSHFSFLGLSIKRTWSGWNSSDPHLDIQQPSSSL
jgi:hypothetical protein